MVDYKNIHYAGKQNNIALTTLGLGCLSIGWYRKYMQKEDAVELIHKTLQRGIRFFDTSPLYGALESEWRLGYALESSGVKREDYTIATKTGYDVTGYAPDFTMPPEFPPRFYDYDFTMRSIEGSLKRLRTDYIDIVHIHDADDDEMFQAAMNGAYKALEKLRDQGVIRGIGVGNNYAKRMAAFAKAGDFDAFLCAGRYSLLDHDTFLEEVQELAEQKNIAITAGGTFSSGLASNPYAEAPFFNYLPAEPDMIQKAQAMDQICQKYDATLRDAAAQFPSFNPVVKSIVLGVGSVEHLDSNIESMNKDLPAALWQELKGKGYIHPNAPVPGDK